MNSIEVPAADAKTLRLREQEAGKYIQQVPEESCKEALQEEAAITPTLLLVLMELGNAEPVQAPTTQNQASCQDTWQGKCKEENIQLNSSKDFKARRSQLKSEAITVREHKEIHEEKTQCPGVM